MNNQSHKRMLAFCTVVLILTFLSPIAFGQIKKELNKKLKKIDGKVTKISIQTDKGTTNFTGREAEEILKKLKKKENGFVFSVNDDSIIDGNNNMVFFSDDDDLFEVKSGKDGIKKTIKVKDVDGKKEVTIKTTKDGKTIVKTLKGKEAQEYLKNNKVHSKYFSWVDKNGKKIKVKSFKFDIKDKDWIDKNDKNIIILKKKLKKHLKDNNDIEKEIEVNITDDVKEVTVTTTKNGKKTVKVYKGKEADEFLKNLEDDDDINIEINGKDNMKKIIIIEKEKRTDKDK